MNLDPGKGSGKFIKSCEFAFKRFALFVFRLLGGIRKRQIDYDPAKINKVLFICHYKLGDMIVSLPVFHNLKRVYPEIRIDLLCGKDNYNIVQSDPNISKIYMYRKKPHTDFMQMRQMRKENYDCVIDLTYGESVTAAIQVSFIAANGIRYGIDKSTYSRYYDKTVEQKETDSHVVTITGSALNLFGIDLDDCDMKPCIFISDENEKIGREFTGGLREKYKNLVGVNLSVGNPGRVWPIEKYISLVENVLEVYDDTAIVLSVAPEDRWKIERVLEVHKRHVVPIPDGLNIIKAAGLLSNLDYLITPDTSIYHFAVAMDIPSVVLFSSNQQNFKRWGPYSPNIIPIRSDDIHNLDSIQPEEVLAALKQLVSRSKVGI
jgi:ADP-heptose:LPS heptosyltransferase